MKTLSFALLAAVSTTALFRSPALADGGSKNVKLHVNPRWKECSLQLDPSLTQDAWHQFTAEAGLLVYFRPLTDAQPMGAGNFEFSILQWQTGIDDTDPAWNDTFVHPDSTHWLFDGDRLAFPGLSLRAGVTDRIDVGVYLTKSPGANYGFWGGQVQYNFVNDRENVWAVSGRGSVVSMFGPEDLSMTVYGVDLLASKEYVLYSDWVFVSPYAAVSGYVSNSYETSAAVNLDDEHVFGVQGTIGAATRISFVRLSAEYNVAKVNTLSFKIGAAF